MTLRQLITNAMTRDGESPEAIKRLIDNTEKEYPPGKLDQELNNTQREFAKRMPWLGKAFTSETNPVDGAGRG